MALSMIVSQPTEKKVSGDDCDEWCVNNDINKKWYTYTILIAVYKMVIRLLVRYTCFVFTPLTLKINLIYEERKPCNFGYPLAKCTIYVLIIPRNRIIRVFIDSNN